MQPLRGVQPLAPDAPSGGRGRQRVAVDRAGDAAARRHRAQPALVHAPLERRDALRLRGLEAELRRVRGGHRPGGRRQRPGPGLDLPRRRGRLALGALADRGPDLPLAAPDAGAGRGRGDAVRRGSEPALEPRRRLVRRPAPGGEDVGAPGGRLRQPRPVPFHLAPLLGGRRPAPERGHRLDGTAARHDRHPGQPASGALARRLAVAGAGDRLAPGGGDRRAPPTTSGRRTSGASRRSSCTARSASSVAPRPGPRTPG